MKKLLMASVAVAAVSIFTPAMAGPGWEFTSPGNSFTNGTWDFATAFTVNQTVTLSGLGYYADPVTGNADGNPVSFYQCDDAACSTTATLLASTNVTNIYPLTGHFRYVTISPITLQAGVSYEVAGVSNSDNYTWDDPGFATDPAITLVTDMSGSGTRWESRSDPAFLNYINYSEIEPDGFWGPNIFLGTPVFAPEPASMAVLGIGLAGLGLVRRKRS